MKLEKRINIGSVLSICSPTVFTSEGSVGELDVDVYTCYFVAPHRRHSHLLQMEHFLSLPRIFALKLLYTEVDAARFLQFSDTRRVSTSVGCLSCVCATVTLIHSFSSFARPLHPATVHFKYVMLRLITY